VLKVFGKARRETLLAWKVDPETFRSACERFPKTLERFWKLPETFRKLPERFLKRPEAFQHLPEGFQNLPEAFHGGIDPALRGKINSRRHRRSLWRLNLLPGAGQGARMEFFRITVDPNRWVECLVSAASASRSLPWWRW
jgi:hypothetical protein